MVVNAIRAIFRILVFVVVSLITIPIMCIVRLLGGKLPHVYRCLYIWKRVIRFALNLRVQQTGTIPQETCLVMSNHRSYTDILLHITSVPVVFVAKASVRSWPIVGWAGRLVGVIFVERSSPRSRARTREDIRNRLERGANVLLYPEGTTHQGPDILDYRPGVFRIAAEENFPVVASAIEYQNQGMAWVGDETFMPHFLKTFGARRIHVKIAFSEPMRGEDAQALRQQVMHWTREHTFAFRSEWDGTSSSEA